MPPPPPRRTTAAGVIGIAAVAASAAAVAAAAVLWATGTGPFGRGVTAGGETPSPSVTTVTVTDGTSPATTSTTGTPAGSSADFSAVYAAVESGVGRVDVDTCGGAFSGSGFLVGPTTVVTAAHVIDGATDIRVTFDGNPVHATVAGVDTSIDLAVLAIPPGSGGWHVFDMAAQVPTPGTHVAVLGYPFDEPKSLTEGTVSGLDRMITTDSGIVDGLIQTDAAINPGNSGGPLLNDAGEVVGLADAFLPDAQAIGFAVPISDARGAIESGAGLTATEPPLCEQAPGTHGVRATLRAYLGAVNARDYDKAMSLVSDSIRSERSRAQWRSDYATTLDDELRLMSVTASATSASVWATFRSQQAAGHGPTGALDATCLRWSIDYSLTRRGAGWIIVTARGHSDPPWVRCD